VEAVILVGIQASGKSTFYRECMFNTHVRVNLDMLRTRHREMLLVHACIRAKQPFVIDNTNPTMAEREKYILPARASWFRVIGYYFPVSIETALLRNTSRSGRQRVPDVAIRGTRNRLEIPSLAEGFSQMFYVRPRPCGGFVVEPWK
jgi:predicted kinase